eukprot:2093590-Pyramimonas_sp.AAC.1
MAHDAPAAVPWRCQVSREGQSPVANLKMFGPPKAARRRASGRIGRTLVHCCQPVRDDIGAAIPFSGCA